MAGYVSTISMLISDHRVCPIKKYGINFATKLITLMGKIKKNQTALTARLDRDTKGSHFL